jgi:hypothetical protein
LAWVDNFFSLLLLCSPMPASIQNKCADFWNSFDQRPDNQRPTNQMRVMIGQGRYQNCVSNFYGIMRTSFSKSSRWVEKAKNHVNQIFPKPIFMAIRRMNNIAPGRTTESLLSEAWKF